MLKVVAEPPTDHKGMDLVREVIDPEIRAFEDWFSSTKRGGSSLTPMERELFRTYLYHKLTSAL